MNASKMKNMIVVKNLPSNIIDEAFIILKPNKKIKVPNTVNLSENIKEIKENPNEYVIKEAEMVITNYLSNLENRREIKSANIKKLENKYKKLKAITVFLGAVIAVYILGKIM